MTQAHDRDQCGSPGLPLAPQRLPDQPASAQVEALARHPIRRAAQLAQLHPQTLREYDRQGLLRPSRTDGGRRLYTDRDLVKARRIRSLTAEGIPMSATRRILRLESALRSSFDRIRVLEDQNRRLSDRLHRLERARR